MKKGKRLILVILIAMFALCSCDGPNSETNDSVWCTSADCGVHESRDNGDNWLFDTLMTFPEGE